MSRIRADKIVNGAGTGAPSFPKGIILSGVSTITADITSADISAENATFSGIITSASLSVSGNVSVGGTLTYEDVTSIDSVGIITAQAGIRVTGGRVGIGTDNPTEDLHVYKSGGSPIIKVETTSPTGGTTLQLKGGSGRVDFGVTGGSSNRGRILYANAANTLNGAAGDRMEFFTNNDLSNSAITITSGNNIGIGSAVPNAKLEVRDGKIRAGTDQSTQGTTIIEGRYTDEGDILNILGSEYSSGATVLSYGMRPKTGGSGYLSSFDNFSGGRNALVLGTDGAKIVTASSQQTTVGSDVTGVASAVMVNINGDVTMRGTDSQYIEMASFKTTNGATLTTNNGGFLSFTPIENTNSSVIVHSTSTNPTRITFPVAGVVHINFHQDIRSGNATSSSHYDYIRFEKNGSTYLNSLIKSTSGFWDNIHGTATIEVASNDYIELALVTNTSISAWDDNSWSSYNFIFAPINTNR